MKLQVFFNGNPSLVDIKKVPVDNDNKPILYLLNELEDDLYKVDNDFILLREKINRKSEILNRLNEIDIKSQRPNRTINICIAKGETVLKDDLDILESYENEVISLRTELEELNLGL